MDKQTSSGVTVIQAFLSLICAAASCLILVSAPRQTIRVPASSQGPSAGGPRLDEAGKSFVNPTGIPLEVLLLHRTGDLVDGQQVLRVEPHSSQPVHLQAGVQIDNLVPLSAAVPINRVPECKAQADRMRFTPAVVREQLAITQHAEQDIARDKEQLAAEQAAINLEQYFDEVHTERSDPLAAELHSERLRDADPATSAQISKQDQQQTNAEMVADVVAMAAANGSVIDAHSEAAGHEADTLQALITRKQEYLAHMQKVYAATETLIENGRRLNAESAVALHAEAVANGAALPDSAHPAFGRFCSGPAFDRDNLGLKLAAPDGVNVLLAHAKFDHGGEEELIFRRVAGTPQWLASMYWPLEATRASVSLQSNSRWSKLGEVQTERPSVKQELATAEKSLGPLKRARRGAQYASEGGDENKTTILP